MEASPDSESIYKQLDTITTNDVDVVRSIGEQIRQTLLTVPIPNDIVEAVKQAWQATGIEHAYAVRSSATAEDLPDASFAGQQDTYLNIIGEARPTGCHPPLLGFPFYRPRHSVPRPE